LTNFFEEVDLIKDPRIKFQMNFLNLGLDKLTHFPKQTKGLILIKTLIHYPKTYPVDIEQLKEFHRQKEHDNLFLQALNHKKTIPATNMPIFIDLALKNFDYKTHL
jgi:hypothetical protein